MSSVETILKGVNSRVLAKNDFEQILTAPSIEEAIDRVLHKPVGSILKRVVENRKFSLEDLFKALFEHYVIQRQELYRNLGPYVFVLEILDDVFDSINALSIIFSEKAGKGYVAPLPFGKIAEAIYEYGNKIGEFLTGDIGRKVKLALSKNIESYSNIFGIVTAKLPFEFILDHNFKKTYGFLRDSTLLRFCISSTEEPVIVPLLISLMRDQFYSICRVKDLKELPHAIKGLNPVYDVFSDALQDTFKLHVGLETFDLAVFLTIHYLTQSLNQNVNQLIAKTYLLLLTESVMTRLALSCLETRLYLDGVKNLVNKWWFLTKM